MLMADAVSKLAAKTPGKEAVAMEAYAKSLRMVRISIFILIDLISKLTKINRVQYSLID